MELHSCFIGKDSSPWIRTPRLRISISPYTIDAIVHRKSNFGRGGKFWSLLKNFSNLGGLRDTGCMFENYL